MKRTNHCSASAFRFCNPCSKCCPIMRSIFVNTLMTFMMNRLGPVILHVTRDPEPSGSRRNSLMLRTENGFCQSTATVTDLGGSDPVMVMTPWPVLPEPLHFEVAP